MKNIKKIGDYLVNEELLNSNILSKMKDIYDEFGIDIHNVPNNLQSPLNDMVKEIIKLRKKKYEKT